MMTLIFIILMLAFFGEMIGLAVKMAWGLIKILCSVIFLPLIIIIFFVCGLAYVAFPILVIAGIVALVVALANKN